MKLNVDIRVSGVLTLFKARNQRIEINVATIIVMFVFNLQKSILFNKIISHVAIKYT